jgi:hypothetical protein
LRLRGVLLLVFDRLKPISQLCQFPLYLSMFLKGQSYTRQQSKYVIVRFPRTLNIATDRIRLATHRLIEIPPGGCQLREYPFGTVMVCAQISSPCHS